MAVKLADTLAPMGDFEIAEAKDVSVDIKGEKKMLQKAIDDGEIGGGGGVQIDDTSTDATDKTWSAKKINNSTKIISDGYIATSYTWSSKKIDDTMASKTTVGDLSELKTTTKSSLVGAINEIMTIMDDVVIESGHNTNGYYRKWSSGFIEQWGAISKGSSLSSKSTWSGDITFPVAFTNTDYNISVTASAYNSGKTKLEQGGEEIGVGFQTESKITFGWYNRNDGTTAYEPSLLWSAKGY